MTEVVAVASAAACTLSLAMKSSGIERGNGAVSVEAALWVNTRCPPTADLFGFDRDGEGNCRLSHIQTYLRRRGRGVDSSELPCRIIHFA